MINITKTIAALSLVAGLVSGCSNKLLFVTHTSLGLDVSGNAQMPDRVSLTYNRQEFAHVPQKADGTSHSVYGGTDSDVSFSQGSVIKQTFATGQAAEIAANTNSSGNNRGISTNECTITNSAKLTCTTTNRAPLIFLTGSTYGLHLSFGDGQVKPSLLTGFRRVEAAYIPVNDPLQEVRPVYADISINSKSNENKAISSQTIQPASTVGGVRIRQSFATGKAALHLAKSPDVRDKLSVAAGIKHDINSPENVELREQYDALLKKVFTTPSPKKADGSPYKSPSEYAEGIAGELRGQTASGIRLRGGSDLKHLIEKLEQVVVQ
jgi:hypothetical protein